MAPKVKVPVYSFSLAIYSLIFFVNFPVHRISNPVANGSRVPAWPTFACTRFLIFFTASAEVQPKGLLTSITRPSSNGFIIFNLSNVQWQIRFPFLLLSEDIYSPHPRSIFQAPLARQQFHTA